MAIKVGGTTVINDNLQIENTAGIDLAPIASTIADTAVDVFVYDTSKDSDGGAWRKRTQGTSWYNETLNTATRGSRKEFPAVAVLVLEDDKLTIYDGDNPDLPMWMVFDMSGTASWTASKMLWTENDHTSTQALNGIIVTTNDGNSGIQTAEFITDQGYIGGTSATLNGFYGGNIEQRNDSLGVLGGAPRTHYLIVNNNVNDVAMTVLPNAPIDPATGLPVPTIAVATDGGTSVIRDDGTVVDITGQYGGGGEDEWVYFDKENALFIGDRSTGAEAFYPVGFKNIPSSDVNIVASDIGYKTTSSTAVLPAPHVLFRSQEMAGSSVGGERGLTHMSHNYEDPASSMVAYTTSTYNTGWMNGDIKLATLSDTDDTDVTGSELVTNGTFDSDTSGWTAINATLSVDANRLKIVDAGSSASATQTISVTAGETYVISFNATAGTASCQAYVSDGTFTVIGSNIPDGVFSYTYTAPSGVSSFVLGLNNSNGVTGQYCFFDNVSVRLAEEDRSVNGNGLQVFGTVTKNPVATGADLVAYSGFHVTDTKLVQPYNSDLAFGTGDFSISFWCKNIGVSSDVMGIGNRGVDQSFGLFMDNGGGLRLTVSENGSTFYQAVEGQFGTSGIGDTWTQVFVVKRGSSYNMYSNGNLLASSAGNYNLYATTRGLEIGKGTTNGGQTNTGQALALLRISATAPSPEQIKKIYEDEKVLFQDNAQATLYGSSDAVTALAYDDSTNLLHVGTSAGRSVFSGLRRVDNTTNAVGAAISASNGLVAED